MTTNRLSDRLDEIARIQSYLRESARGSYESVALPPFTLFFHPSDALKYFNYAIPDRPVRGDLSAELAELRRVFRQYERLARFEFFEAFAPELPEILRTCGFIEEGRQWSMLCSPAALRSPDMPPGLEVVEVTSGSEAADLAGFILTQREGFHPERAAPPTPSEIEHARFDLKFGAWRAFLGRLDGQPAGVATFGRPIDGVSEIAGVATRPAFRRRGIAACLTAWAARAAFETGAQTACLTAADASAGRVYERAGFQPFSIMLAYEDGGEKPEVS